MRTFKDFTTAEEILYKNYFHSMSFNRSYFIGAFRVTGCHIYLQFTRPSSLLKTKV